MRVLSSHLLPIPRQHLRRNHTSRGAHHSNSGNSTSFPHGRDSLKLSPAITLLQSPAQGNRIGDRHQQHTASERLSRPLHHRRHIPSHRRSAPQRHPCLGTLMRLPQSYGVMIGAAYHPALVRAGEWCCKQLGMIAYLCLYKAGSKLLQAMSKPSHDCSQSTVQCVT